MRKLFFIFCFVVFNCVLYAEDSKDFFSSLENKEKNENDFLDSEDDLEEYEENEKQSYENGYYEKSIDEKIFQNIFWNDKFYIEQKLSYPKGFKLNAGVNAQAYSGFINFQTASKELKYKPEIYSTGFRFTPLFIKNKNGKLTPAFSFYAGAIKIPKVFYRFENPAFSNIKPSYPMPAFPAVNLLNLSASQKKLGLGTEFALPFFNFLFLYMPDKTETKGDFKIYASFSKRDFENPFMKLNISFVSAFFPKSATKKILQKDKRYAGYYGTEIFFLSEFFSFDVLGALNYIPSLPVSGAFRGEAVFSYKPFSLNFGFSYREKNYTGKQSGKQKEYFVGFIKPQFHFSIIKIAASYSFSRLYNSKENIQSYGIDAFVIHKNVIYKNKLFYRNGIYDYYTELKLKDFTDWFSFARMYASFRFQHKSINPFCVKKYYSGAGLQFNISDKVKLGFESTAGQKNVVKKKNIPIIEWQKLELSGAAYLRFGIKEKQSSHTGSLYFKLKNTAAFFAVTAAYKISF